MSIGWIGIGRMGYAMAERLAKSGADVTVWNRTRSKAEPLAQLRRESRRASSIWRHATSCSSWCRRGTT
jgi:3-hydroxyisobutyrate dehydrogenase-like beta-hydroxyacid dehydrogenase